MRIKTFTLMLLTFLVSTLSLAQKHDLSMPSVKPSRPTDNMYLVDRIYGVLLQP